MLSTWRCSHRTCNAGYRPVSLRALHTMRQTRIDALLRGPEDAVARAARTGDPKPAQAFYAPRSCNKSVYTTRHPKRALPPTHAVALFNLTEVLAKELTDVSTFGDRQRSYKFADEPISEARLAFLRRAHNVVHTSFKRGEDGQAVLKRWWPELPPLEAMLARRAPGTRLLELLRMAGQMAFFAVNTLGTSPRTCTVCDGAD